MSTRYEESGRTRQKQRTRNELIASARELIARGGAAPTVEQAAAAAAISRTTAYRYFPSQRALLAAAHPETALDSLLPLGAGDDPAERLAAVVAAFTTMIIDTEQQQRTMLRLSLDADEDSPDLPLRKGRAVGWFEEALRPSTPQLTEQEIRELAIAVRSAVGIESLVWLTDIAGLRTDQAQALMGWTAQALLSRALSVGVPGVTRRRARPGSGPQPGRA
jgi:AcrR family transcriptional regulator